MQVFRTTFLLLLLLLFASFTSLFFVIFSGLQHTAPLPVVVGREGVRYEEKQADSYTIFLAGDVMLDRGVAWWVARHDDADWRFPWQFVADRLRLFDIVFVNHEGVMSDFGRDAGGVYSFNFPLAALDGLLFASVDVVNLANNHSFDQGAVALCDTVRRLRAHGVGTVGAGCSYDEANAPYVRTFRDGSSVGFLGYTSFYENGAAGADYPGISDYSLEFMRERVAALKGEVDVVVVSLHWGNEYHGRSNKGQQRVGRMLVDAGADVIVGHHPHVIQEVERYNGGWILYSLGNFIFDQYFSEETMEGLTAVVTVRGGDVMSVVTEKVLLNKYYQPMFEGVQGAKSPEKSR